MNLIAGFIEMLLPIFGKDFGDKLGSRLVGLLFAFSAVVANAEVLITQNTTISDSSLDGQDVVVDGAGVALTLASGHSYNLASLHLRNGSTLTAGLPLSESDGPIDVVITGSLEIEAGSAIDLTGKGHTFASNQSNHSAGTHGGIGGNHSGYPSN